MTRRDPVPLCSLALFGVVWLALAVAPRDRPTWLLENLPTLVALPVLFIVYRHGWLSHRSYAQISGFLVLHTIGSHYTYAQVPLGFWVKDVFGLSRNHYDRFVHFSFGLLMFLPNYELAFREKGPVDFPEPEVPITATKSPRSTTSETSLNARSSISPIR